MVICFQEQRQKHKQQKTTNVYVLICFSIRAWIALTTYFKTHVNSVVTVPRYSTYSNDIT